MTWRVEEYENNVSERSVRVVAADGEIIADNEPYYPQALNPKHAHLIAAAPDLLEAAKEVLEWMNQLPIPTTGCTAKGILLYAAIAKATK